MPWPSIDSYLSDITVNNKFRSLFFSRLIAVGASAAGGTWADCFSSRGTGGPMTLTGTPGTGLALNNSTAGALPLGPDVSPALRRLLFMSVVGYFPSFSLPGMAMLTDLIHVYRSCALTGAPSSLSTHPTWTGTGDTRMSSPVGTQISLGLSSAGTAGNGNLTATYLNQSGASKTTSIQVAPLSTLPTGNFYNRANQDAVQGDVLFGLSPGDTGVSRISSYTIGTGLTGADGYFLIHRPICTVPLTELGRLGERNFISGLPTFPRVYDDSCLVLLVNTNSIVIVSNSVITGELDFGWGA